MNVDKLVKAIKLIALENPDGFTVELETMELIASGIVSAYKETQDSFQDAGLKKCINHALNHDKLIGGWRNPKGIMQYDSCKVFIDRDKAIEFGQKTINTQSLISTIMRKLFSKSVGPKGPLFYFWHLSTNLKV